MNDNEQIIYKIMQVVQGKTGMNGRWYVEANNKIIDGMLELKNGRQTYTAAAICK